MSFESWSRIILLNFFADKLTEEQRNYLNGNQFKQLELF